MTGAHSSPHLVRDDEVLHLVAGRVHRTPGRPAAAPTRSREERLKRTQTVCCLIAAVSLTLCLVARGWLSDVFWVVTVLSALFGVVSICVEMWQTRNPWLHAVEVKS